MTRRPRRNPMASTAQAKAATRPRRGTAADLRSRVGPRGHTDSHYQYKPPKPELLVRLAWLAGLVRGEPEGSGAVGPLRLDRVPAEQVGVPEGEAGDGDAVQRAHAHAAGRGVDRAEPAERDAEGAEDVDDHDLAGIQRQPGPARAHQQ